MYPRGHNAKKFSRMVEFGMTPLQAIQSATIHSADLLGWQDKVGQIAPGYFADIIAADGSPLENVSVPENVGFVMKSGVV